MNPIEAALLEFELYAALKTDEATEAVTTPVNLSLLQAQLVRWHVRNFGAPAMEFVALAAVEELGEACHAILKHHQKIRGFEDEKLFKEKAGDAIADCAVCLIQLATCLRLDFGKLLTKTAAEVMQRNWRDNPLSAHEK